MIQDKPAIDLKSELETLYKKWPDVKRYLKSKGCNSTDAEDIFQEALLIFTRKLKSPDFELTVEPFHYVKNTCKFIWYNQSRKESKHRQTELHENFSNEEDDDEWILKELKLKSIEDALSQIGKQCQQILQMFYGLSLTMVDIAKKLGMRNDKVAKSQKYRCINKVKEIISNDSTDPSIQH
jgi:RNA polymerase sigma factor (sigma-70 family)